MHRVIALCSRETFETVVIYVILLLKNNQTSFKDVGFANVQLCANVYQEAKLKLGYKISSNSEGL